MTTPNAVAPANPATHKEGNAPDDQSLHVDSHSSSCGTRYHPSHARRGNCRRVRARRAAITTAQPSIAHCSDPPARSRRPATVVRRPLRWTVPGQLPHDESASRRGRPGARQLRRRHRVADHRRGLLVEQTQAMPSSPAARPARRCSGPPRAARRPVARARPRPRHAAPETNSVSLAQVVRRHEAAHRVQGPRAVVPLRQPIGAEGQHEEVAVTPALACRPSIARASIGVLGRVVRRVQPSAEASPRSGIRAIGASTTHGRDGDPSRVGAQQVRAGRPTPTPNRQATSGASRATNRRAVPEQPSTRDVDTEPDHASGAALPATVTTSADAGRHEQGQPVARRDRPCPSATRPAHRRPAVTHKATSAGPVRRGTPARPRRSRSRPGRARSVAAGGTLGRGPRRPRRRAGR